jgi:Na/Pi-cotransporter
MSVNSVKELVFGIIGGTALLMYGVDLMTDGLQKASGGLIKKALSVLTGRLWSAFLTGTFITAAVQSSTAVTVLTVNLVNSGLMGLKQAVGVIYGANIGTTITAQLIAFRLTDIALPVIGAGFIIMYFSKKDGIKYIGQGILGCGILFLGLKFLDMGVPYLRSSPMAAAFFQHYGSNIFVSVIIGMLATMVIQSSSATVGITMALAGAGLITIDGAIGFMLGDNIGTCLTAQIAAAAGSISARRTAWAHTFYNIIGVLIALIAIKPFIALIRLLSPGMGIERQIANSHTMFNVLSAFIFLPMTDLYVKFIKTIVTDRRKK